MQRTYKSLILLFGDILDKYVSRTHHSLEVLNNYREKTIHTKPRRGKKIEIQALNNAVFPVRVSATIQREFAVFLAIAR